MRRPDTGILFGFILMLVICVKLFYSQPREDFTGLFLSVSLCFLLYAYLLWRVHWLRHDVQVHLLIAGAILIRAAGLFAIPNLSDDLFRFIWDGNLRLQGVNPFLFTPRELISAGSDFRLDPRLFEQLNSPDYYTVYPPVMQGIFLLSAWLGGASVLFNSLIMKLILFAAEIGSILQIRWLLKKFGKPVSWVLIYALNPLILLEFAGNLHFEAVMIFFLLFGWRLMLQEKWIPAFLIFALAVNTKLIPLILLPYLIFSLEWRKRVQLLMILGGTSLLLWFPFLSGKGGEHLFSSLNLYFRSFEFNASIYYLLRWVGFQVKGYNIIQSLGPWLASASTVLIIGTSWRLRGAKLRHFPVVFMASLTALYFLSTTVHPWYITLMMAFVPFTRWIYPLVWSYLIYLSYQAYRSLLVVEQPVILFIEYGLLFAFLAFEWRRNRKQPEEGGLLQDWLQNLR